MEKYRSLGRYFRYFPMGSGFPPPPSWSRSWCMLGSMHKKIPSRQTLNQCCFNVLQIDAHNIKVIFGIELCDTL